MILIAHRGNINGPVPELENHPEYILRAIREGFDVEMDVWYKNNNWYLGHDLAQCKIDFEFLEQSGLWIHCKNYEALQELSQLDLNVFYHTDEDYVLTSQNYIWAYSRSIW